jgi:hypothetical protein
MKIEYTPTFSDFKKAVRLDRKVNVSSLIFHLGMTWFAPSIAVLLILLIVVASCLSAAPVVQFDSGSFVTLVMLATCFLAPYFEKRILRRKFQSMFPENTIERKVCASIVEDGIEVAIPGIAETKYQWGAVVNFLQNDFVLLIYFGKTRLLFFPVSAFTTAQRTELNDLVARNFVRKQK